MKNLIKYLVILVIILNIGSQLNVAAAETLDTGFNAGVSDAPSTVFVSAVQSDGKILVGGFFQFVNGIQRSYLSRLNPNGTLDSSFNSGGSGANDGIFQIKVLPDGKILIGGAFTVYNGTAIGGLARLNSDGSLDTSFNSGGTGVVSSNVPLQTFTLQPDGKILIVVYGAITYNGTPIHAIARINQDGTLDTSFTSGFDSDFALVNKIGVQSDGKILIGGDLGNYNGVSLNRIARLNSNGTLDNTFNSPLGPNGEVYEIAVQSDGKILIGGYSPVIARLNADGSIDTSFTPASLGGSVIDDITIQPDGKILAAGTYDSNVPYQYSPLVRLNANGTIDNSFQQKTVDGSGYSVQLQTDGKIILAGKFSNYGNQIRNGIVRLDSNGDIDNSFNASLTAYGIVNAVAQQPDGKILVGGLFQTVGGNLSNCLVRFNLDGMRDTSFNIGSGTAYYDSRKAVLAIAVQPDGKILVGGEFGSFNGVGTQNIVRLNANGSVDASFNVTEFESTPSRSVNDIIIQADGKILIGGGFSRSGSSTRNLLRLNSNGSIDTTFNSGGSSPNGRVYKIARQTDGKFIIGGSFSIYNGISRNRIARINADGTLDASFNPGTGGNGIVYDAALQSDGKILIGGTFTTFNGSVKNRITRLNTDGSLDNTFNAGTGADKTVYSIILAPNGKIIIGGLFANYNGTARNYLAKLNTDGSLDSSLGSGFVNNNFYVRKLTYQTDGKLLVGGRFDSYNGVPRNSLLRLSTTSGSTLFDFDGDGKSDISVFRPANGAWYLNQSQAGFTGILFGQNGDKIVPADYDGDGKTDVAVYRGGIWYLQRSSLGFTGIAFGDANDIPVPADYDGDGKADVAVFRPSNGAWYLLRSSLGFTGIVFGQNGDKPVAADYDGDGKADVAVFRNGNWYLNRSQLGFTGVAFGEATDKPVPADYDGDGKADVAVFRPSNGVWYLNRSQLGFTGAAFGFGTDLPVAADYDGDGKADIAVFRNGAWYLLQSTAGFTGVVFGTTNDQPIPNAFVP